MTSFAPDSLVLNRKLPLWYQVSQSLRASILGRAPETPAAAAHRGAARRALRGERADHAAGAQGAGGRGPDQPAPAARHLHRAGRAAGRAGAAAGLGRRDRGPAVGRADDRCCGPRPARRCPANSRSTSRTCAEVVDVPPAALRRARAASRPTGRRTRPSGARRPHRPRRPGALADDEGAAGRRRACGSAGSPTRWRRGSPTRRRPGCSRSRCSARSCTTRA